MKRVLAYYMLSIRIWATSASVENAGKTLMTRTVWYAIQAVQVNAAVVNHFFLTDKRGRQGASRTQTPWRVIWSFTHSLPHPRQRSIRLGLGRRPSEKTQKPSRLRRPALLGYFFAFKGVALLKDSYEILFIHVPTPPHLHPDEKSIMSFSFLSLHN